VDSNFQDTKFRPLTGIHDALRRPGLVQRCMEGSPSDARLTLVVAPAGFGKTTLLGTLREAYEATGYRTVWLNCDELDQDPHTLGGSLARALKHAGIVLRGTLRGIEDISRKCTGLPYRLVIILDEFDAAANERHDSALENIARTAPDNLRIVVATRAQPKRNFVRLQLDGCLRLIDAASLRFTEDEAREFLSGMGSSDAVSELIARAEGWPFVLQLLRLYAQRQVQSGTIEPVLVLPESRIADYLASEVMSRLDPELRGFAIETSLLTSITVEDAIGATGRDDCAALLHRLEPLVPIVTLDHNPLSARFHPLFREYLRTELDKTGRAYVVRLHERVALQYANTQRIYQAVRCALAGGLTELAVSILERAGGIRYLISAGLTDARRVLNLLPRAAIERRLRLRLMSAGTMILQERDDDAPRELAIIEAELQEGRFEGQLDEIAKGDLATTQSLVRIAEVDHRLAQPEWETLHAATERAAEAARNDARLSIGPLLLESILLLRQGDLTRADPLIDAYIAINEHDGRFQTSSDARTYRGIYSLARGELDEAELTVSRAAAALLARDGHEEGQSAQTVHATMGQIRYLRNDIMGAATYFDRIRDDHAYVIFEAYAAKHVWRAQCDVALGNFEAALERLDRADKQAASRNLVHLAVLAGAMRREVQVTHQGDPLEQHPPEALDEVARLLDTALTGETLPWFTRTWVIRANIATAIAQERHTDAIHIAEGFIQTVSGSSRRLLEAEAWLLLARAAGSSDINPRVRAAVGRALLLTADTGAYRLFFDAGSSVLACVSEWATANSGPQSEWAGQIAARMTPVDRLSWRQRAVLRELCKGYSNKEIARVLRLSPETVKWYLKGIFDHFGLSSREAVIQAATRPAQVAPGSSSQTT